MIARADAQWWAGAIAAAIVAGTAVLALPHPWDGYITAAAAALGGFSAYRISPPSSSSLKESPHV